MILLDSQRLCSLADRLSVFVLTVWALGGILLFWKKNKQTLGLRRANASKKNDATRAARVGGVPEEKRKEMCDTRGA